MAIYFEVYCLGSHWGVYWLDNANDRAKLNRFATDRTGKYYLKAVY